MLELRSLIRKECTATPWYQLVTIQILIPRLPIACPQLRDCASCKFYSLCHIRPRESHQKSRHRLEIKSRNFFLLGCCVACSIMVASGDTSHRLCTMRQGTKLKYVHEWYYILRLNSYEIKKKLINR